MNKKLIIILVVVVVALAVGYAAISKPKSTLTSTSSNSATKKAPGLLPTDHNPIVNKSLKLKPGLEISAISVENNVDPNTKQQIPDRLQLSLKNTSTQTMNNFEIYYTMKDQTTGASEAYYEKLAGLSIKPGEVKTIFFDNKTGPYHYAENQYSLYRTSKNAVDISVEISATGYKIATAKATKSVGTGEKVD